VPQRLDPSTLRQFAPALRSGAVLHLFQPIAGKAKYHVLIASADERSLGFIINSRPSPFIMRNLDLQRRQVLMGHATHPFMHHDSFIACHDTVSLPPRERLVDGMLKGQVDHVGAVARELHAQIAAAARGSPLIATREAALIVAAFGA
jgi:hypothetical protein